MFGNVLITGASKGIGKAIALDLDNHGYRVFAGVRKEDDGHALKSEASEKLYPIILDVTDKKSIESASQEISQTVGNAGLYGLVNNAGVSMVGVLEYLPLEDFQYQLEVNLIGQLAVTQAILPMIYQAKGRIINMGSAGGSRLVMPGMSAYSVSKAGLEMLTDGLRVELKQSGIDVISVLPGAVKTPIWNSGKSQLSQIDEVMSDESRVRYQHILERLRGFYEQSAETGIPPKIVAEVVCRALSDTRPKTRYYVGLDTWRYRLLSLLPDRWIDRLILV